MRNEEPFEYWSKVLDKLFYNPYSYWAAYFQYPFSRDSDYNNYVTKEVKLACGASRGTLISDNCDWVVKFPLTFECSNGIDYCEKEIQIYNEAKNWGLADYFAEVHFLGTYKKKIEFWNSWEIERYFNLFYEENEWEQKLHELIKEKKLRKRHTIYIEIPLYAYRKAKKYSAAKMWQLSREDEKFAKSSNSPLAKSSLGVAVAFRDWYGLNVFEELSEFARTFNINDLHSGNIGIIEDRLTFIDYAGFFEEEETNFDYYS